MRITLQPKFSTEKSLTGDLLVNESFFLYWLTLPLKDGLPGSAIPPGTYSVMIAPSPKFERLAVHDPWIAKYSKEIPHIMGIPNRSNILVHWGNTAVDTDGCILIGLTRAENFVGSSRAAFEKLQPLIVAACNIPTEGCQVEMLAGSDSV